MKLVEHELKDIFEENEQDFDVKSRTLSHFVATEEHMAEKAILIVTQNRCEITLADSVVQLAIVCIYMRRMGYDSATVNIQFSSQSGRVVTQYGRK